MPQKNYHYSDRTKKRTSNIERPTSNIEVELLKIQTYAPDLLDDIVQEPGELIKINTAKKKQR